jgi:uncharacterized protein (TIGR03034 family)
VVQWELPVEFIKSLRGIKTDFPLDREGKSLLVDESSQIASEDLRYADKTNSDVLSINPLFSAEIFQSKIGDDVLFNEMHLLGGFASANGGENAKANTTALINHLEKNSGEDFHSSFLDEALSEVLDEDNGNNFLFGTGGAVHRFEEELRKYKGNTNHIKTLNPKTLRMHRVQFDKLADVFNGKQFAVHDTHAFRVDATDYELLANNRYNATFHITYYDHFGLDITDVKKFILVNGFRAWYYLQHVRVYKPFITVFQCDKHIRNRSF